RHRGRRSRRCDLLPPGQRGPARKRRQRGLGRDLWALLLAYTEGTCVSAPAGIGAKYSNPARATSATVQARRMSSTATVKSAASAAEPPKRRARKNSRAPTPPGRNGIKKPPT